MEGVFIDFEKVFVVKFWLLLINVFELCVFLGKIGYYRKFILDFVIVVSFFFFFEEKGRNFVWFNDC